jgi:dihydrofolate reductase
VGTIAVHEFMSLDGVFESPSWTAEYEWDDAMLAAVSGLMMSSKAILLGRQTYEEFEPAWSSRTAEEDEGAPFMNESPKYVVSGTLESATWSNSTIVGPYSAEAIQSVKDQVNGPIYVSGSGTLVRGMLADGLVDELHLFVYPLTLGSGKRLFGDGDAVKLELAQAEGFSQGIVHLAYRSA